MKICRMCLNRGKVWEGSDPVCYFDNPGGNWNCATVQAIRNLVFTGGMFEIGREKLPDGINKQYCDDDYYATIKIDEVRMGRRWIGTCLYLEWYKNRGRTDALWILGGVESPRAPTEEELLEIIKHYLEEGAYDWDEESRDNIKRCREKEVGP